jgi:UDP-2-acetamido-3-amino-2,3-dideoxy-glucuronate N-acetyltransferase
MSGLRNKINIALIGAGYWGKNLARNFAELGSLYCVCDPNPATAQSIALEYNVPVLRLEHIFEDKEISAIAIATPAVTHYEIAKKALKFGKHVFVEKPMVLDLDHAKELCEIAKFNQRKLMVGHLLQYHPVFIKLKEIIHSGALGPIQYLYSHRLDLGKIYTRKDTLWNLAPHDLSMVLSLANSKLSSLSATSSCNIKPGVADFATINMEFMSGSKAHIFVSWLNPFKEQKLTVICENGMAVFDDTIPEWNQKLAIYNHKIEINPYSVITIKEPAKFVEIEKSEPLRDECQHFINSIEYDTDPITNGEEALKVIEVLAKARAAFTNKKEFV